MSVTLKCAACGHEAPFDDGSMTTEAICPGCEVLLRRRSPSDTMAIPVSMALPDEFEPANLERVPKNGQELIHRFQKNGSSTFVNKAGDSLSDSNLVLAKAIERLADAIGAQGGAGVYQPKSAKGEHLPRLPSPHANGEFYEGGEVPVLNGGTHTNGAHANGEAAANGAHPELEEDLGPEKAQPIGSPVLVRREAAAEAHRFERRAQAATDIKGPQQSAFAVWVEKHPYLMLGTGLILLIALVVMTTILMEGTLITPEEEVILSSAMAGETVAGDADYNHAEKEARGFLNAIALNPAKPYIFRATAIGPKLEKFFEPLPNPADYELELTGRQKHDNKAVYYYQVTSDDHVQPLVVLQEDETFKVFWEFGACLGDISWRAFLDDEPKEPILMRAFLKPDLVYDSIHNQEQWTSWLAENWDGSLSARVFCKIGSPEDRRLKSALEEHSILRNELKWVMAQVRLQHIGTSFDRSTGAFEAAEIVEVPLGSWLPEEFVDGNTFYPESDQVKGYSNEIRGLQRRSTLYQ